MMNAASTPGMILGTAAYMSPEQAKGKETDRAADAWAFGCVLYEMLTGRAVFEGETMGEILGGIFKTEPDWNRLPAGTPEAIRRLLRRCLRKEEKLRLRDFRDARIEIEEAQSGREHAPQPKGPPRVERLAWISALALVTVIAVVSSVLAFRPTAPAAEARLEITTPPPSSARSLAISPDGQKIVFEAVSEGRSQLWVRALDSVSAQPLAGTDRAQDPFWSPDNRSIGFFADGNLKRIDIGGASAKTLTEAIRGRRIVELRRHDPLHDGRRH